MPIRFQCRSCDTRIRVPDGSEGKKVKCPRCSELQRVPGNKPKPTEPGDIVRLDADPINRPKRGKKRDPEYVPKHMRDPAPQPPDQLKPGEEDAPDKSDASASGSDVPGARDEGGSSMPNASSGSDAAVAGESSAARSGTGKPLGDSVADQTDEADNREAQDSHVSRDKVDEPLLTLDSEPDEPMSSGELPITGEVSRADSIDVEKSQVGESLEEASSISGDVQEADEQLEVVDPQPVTEAKPKAPPKQPRRAISLSAAESDDKESPQAMDEPEPIIEPEPAETRTQSSRPSRSSSRAPSRSTPSPIFESPSRGVPQTPAGKPPNLLGLLIVAYMLRAFAVIMFIWALLSAFTLLPAAMGMDKQTRMGYILGFMGLALLFWGLGEIAGALRIIARKQS
jgi:predicted Zn finger-like uncharacterized protein